MMYQDYYSRQEVYCDAKAGENDYCTYMDPDMLLETCTQTYEIENEAAQWHNSTLSSPVDVQMQHVEKMPLPPSPTDTLVFSPYSETISQQPSPIEGTFDYYSPPMHDFGTRYDYSHYSQLSPLMEDHHHHHSPIHHHQHDAGAMYPPQYQPVYPSIISRQVQHQDHSVVLDSTTPATPAAVELSSTPATAMNTKITASADNTTVRPYPCYLCSRSFARKHDLQRHIRVHTGAKPYACLCCKKAFARTDALKRHLRMEEACRKSPEIQAMKCAGKRRYRNL